MRRSGVLDQGPTCLLLQIGSKIVAWARASQDHICHAFWPMEHWSTTTADRCLQWASFMLAMAGEHWSKQRGHSLPVTFYRRLTLQTLCHRRSSCWVTPCMFPVFFHSYSTSWQTPCQCGTLRRKPGGSPSVPRGRWTTLKGKQHRRRQGASDASVWALQAVQGMEPWDGPPSAWAVGHFVRAARRPCRWLRSLMDHPKSNPDFASCLQCCQPVEKWLCTDLIEYHSLWTKSFTLGRFEKSSRKS